MKERKGDWIQTYKGIMFYPLDPRQEEIDIEDIAHSLSNQCRFSGHLKTFFSVAQHCVYVADWLQERFPHNYQLQLAGLLHDASEAYLVDLPRPIKNFSEIGTYYRAAEHELMRVIGEKFGVDFFSDHTFPHWSYADNAVLLAEKRDLFPSQTVWKVLKGIKEYDVKIHPVSPFFAKTLFLERFRDLRRMPNGLV